MKYKIGDIVRTKPDYWVAFAEFNDKPAIILYISQYDNEDYVYSISLTHVLIEGSLVRINDGALI